MPRTHATHAIYIAVGQYFVPATYDSPRVFAVTLTSPVVPCAGPAPLVSSRTVVSPVVASDTRTSPSALDFTVASPLTLTSSHSPQSVDQEVKPPQGIDGLRVLARHRLDDQGKAFDVRVCDLCVWDVFQQPPEVFGDAALREDAALHLGRQLRVVLLDHAGISSQVARIRHW